MTVGRRVALLVSLSVALSVIAMGVAAYITTRITLFNKLDSQLTRIASTVSGPIQVDMKNLDGVGSRSVDVTDEVIVNLVRADNSITVVSGTNRTVVTEPSELAVARLGWGISSRTGVDSQNEPIRIVAVPLSIDRGNSDPVEHYALVIGEPLDTTYGVLQSLWIILIVAGAVGVIATTLTGLWAANNTIRPIRDLSRAVHEVAETGEITPIKVHSDDELGELAASVNVMLTNLEKSRERQKRLIGDAS
ncbi:MAG: HAMP domain-containing protein, partial [Propionibacterium sp.]|nr:HAMP domain-containing protein [Propionibacterium sp.]